MELDMNLLYLRYFAKLAQTLHYTRAAEHLCIAQPSLSHAISQMEAELGVPLFEKVGKSIVLTHYGEQIQASPDSCLTGFAQGVLTLFSPLWRSFTPLTLPRPFLIHRFILPKAPVFVL